MPISLGICLKGVKLNDGWREWYIVREGEGAKDKADMWLQRLSQYMIGHHVLRLIRWLRVIVGN
jgi:hypothetical protein